MHHRLSAKDLLTISSQIRTALVVCTDESFSEARHFFRHGGAWGRQQLKRHRPPYLPLRNGQHHAMR